MPWPDSGAPKTLLPLLRRLGRPLWQGISLLSFTAFLLLCIGKNLRGLGVPVSFPAFFLRSTEPRQPTAYERIEAGTTYAQIRTILGKPQHVEWLRAEAQDLPSDPLRAYPFVEYHDGGGVTRIDFTACEIVGTGLPPSRNQPLEMMVSRQVLWQGDGYTRSELSAASLLSWADGLLYKGRDASDILPSGYYDTARDGDTLTYVLRRGDGKFWVATRNEKVWAWGVEPLSRPLRRFDNDLAVRSAAKRLAEARAGFIPLPVSLFCRVPARNVTDSLQFFKAVPVGASRAEVVALHGLPGPADDPAPETPVIPDHNRWTYGFRDGGTVDVTFNGYAVARVDFERDREQRVKHREPRR